MPLNKWQAVIKNHYKSTFLTCSTPTYAKGLDQLGLKRSPKKKTFIGHSRNGWPIIYEVHILYIVHVLSPMAQVSVGNNACPVRYSAVLHYLKSGAPNEDIVQNHLTLALLNVFLYLNGRYRHIFIP